MKINLFGKIIKLHLGTGSAFETLSEELSAYQKAPSEKVVDVNIYFNEKKSSPVIGTNPLIHQAYRDGFQMKVGVDSYRFEIDDDGIKSIYISWKSGIQGLKGWRSKWQSMEFAGKDEAIGKIIHELVLVPLTFFDAALVPVHSSGMVCPETGKLVLIGGTGGVGKTSLELVLCGEKGYKFFADDITIIDKDGIGYANMAYPKIYGYNLENQDQVKSRVFAKRKLIDKLQWQYAMRRRGPSRVRRRVDPRTFYDGVENSPIALGKYVILVRSDVDRIEISELATEEAVKMSIKVMESEYGFLFNHMHWWEYNLLIKGEAIKWSYANMIQRWSHVMTQSLEGIQCRLIKLPIGIQHQQMKEEVSRLVNEL